MPAESNYLRPPLTQQFSHGRQLPSPTQVRRTQVLSLFFPVGAISKQGFQYINEDDIERGQHLRRQGYVATNNIEIKAPDRKRTFIYYSIIPKGLQYVKTYGNDIPEWIRNMPEWDTYEKWGSITKPETPIRLVQLQDSIAYFTLAGCNTLLTELWQANSYSISTLLGMTKILSNQNHRMFLDCVFQGLMTSLDDHESELKENCLRVYNGIIPDSPVIRNYLDLSQSRLNYYGGIREISGCYSSFGNDAKNQKTLRDNNIGIYSTPHQELSVYVSTFYGLKYSRGPVIEGCSYNRTCASRISQYPGRSGEKRCASCIVLCRTVPEMVRVVLDQYHIRKGNDGYFGIYHDYSFLIPMTDDGFRLLSLIKDVDPKRFQETLEAENNDLVEIFDDLTFVNGKPVNTKTNAPWYNGSYMEASVLYDALINAEEQHCVSTIVCEDWQAPYYEAIIEQWKKTPLTESGRNGSYDILLEPITLESEREITKKWTIEPVTE